jgi:iron(III) transport system substrate-binding protein
VALGVVAATVGALVLAACSASSAPQKTAAQAGGPASGSWAQVVTQAKSEGKVVVYSALQPQELQALQSGFEKKYGITVEFLRTGSDQAVARMDQERSSGADGADVGIVTEEKWYQERTAAHQLLPLTGPGAQALKQANPTDFSNDYGVAQIIPWVLAWNTKLLPQGLSSWKSLLAPGLRGKLGLLGLSNTEVLSIYDYLGQKYGDSYLKSLAAQKPHFYVSQVPMAQAIGSGEVSGGSFEVASTVEALVKQGAPLKYASPTDFAFGVEIYAAALGWSKRPAAAKLFVDYLLSKDGQNTLFNADNGTGGVSPLGKAAVPSSVNVKNLVITDQSKYTTAVTNSFTSKWNAIFTGK